jgi:glycosyltransferase involved in cell wall biosynthesis
MGQNWIQASVQILYRRALQKNVEVWFLNHDDQQVFLMKNLVSREKSFLLPGEGIDTDTFYPAPYENAKKEVIFLLVGRIIKHKGIYEFVKAAEWLRQKGLAVKLQLLGFFDEDNPVAISREQVAEWERRNIISYLGHTDEVAPFIAQADCIVLPSYREGIPLSLLEGASMSKALIATDVAGCRELIRDGVNGYLCKKKDWVDLAGKMEKYYQLPAEEKRRMGVEGRNWILERFNREFIVGIYLDKIKAFLQNGHEY